MPTLSGDLTIAIYPLRHRFFPQLKGFRDGSPPLERRLAAILAADVEGYSRLMHGDEEGTIATLSARRSVVEHVPLKSRNF